MHIINEKKRIEVVTSEKGPVGHIELDHLAKPDTVRVKVLGKEIIPESFDIYGNPIFTMEQAILFAYHEKKMSKNNAYADITYEENPFEESRDSIDTIESIKIHLGSLSDFNKLIKKRKLFLKSHPGDTLHSFVIFNRLLLDQSGLVRTIKPDGVTLSEEDIEDYDDFYNRNPQGIILTAPHSVPEANAKCPCCGAKFTIDMLRDDSCISATGKWYHSECFKELDQVARINHFTKDLMSMAYDDYWYELIPNRSKSDSDKAPWFMFHTPDGDIVIGPCQNHISVEWQDNYKSFDIFHIFNDRTVSWQRGQKRGVTVTSRNKAFEYIKTVRDFVEHCSRHPLASPSF